MPIDDRTEFLSLAKPNQANLLEEDVARLRDFADDVDLALQLRPLATTVSALVAAAVAPLAATAYVDAGLGARALASRTVSAGAGLDGGGALTGNVTLSLSAGTLASLALADTAVQPARSIFTGGGLQGGGDLSSNRTIAPVFANSAEALGGVATARIMNPLRTAEYLTSKYATPAEALAGTAEDRVMSPARAAELVNAKVATRSYVFPLIFG